MSIGEWFNAYLEAEYRVLIEEQRKAANRKSRYAIQKQYPPTLLDHKERTMNDLKPLARYLSPILIAVSILIVIFIFIHVPSSADYPFIAIMLALVAIWLQGVTKT